MVQLGRLKGGIRMLKVGDKLLVRKPSFGKAIIHTVYKDGTYGIEINGYKHYSIRESHIIKKLEG
jgi:hypothetical protein